MEQCQNQGEESRALSLEYVTKQETNKSFSNNWLLSVWWTSNLSWVLEKFECSLSRISKYMIKKHNRFSSVYKVVKIANHLSPFGSIIAYCHVVHFLIYHTFPLSGFPCSRTFSTSISCQSFLFCLCIRILMHFHIFIGNTGSWLRFGWPLSWICLPSWSMIIAPTRIFKPFTDLQKRYLTKINRCMHYTNTSLQH